MLKLKHKQWHSGDFNRGRESIRFNDDYADFDIPFEILITDFEDSIVAIVDSIYPFF